MMDSLDVDTGSPMVKLEPEDGSPMVKLEPEDGASEDSLASSDDATDDFCIDDDGEASFHLVSLSVLANSVSACFRNFIAPAF